MTSADLSLAIGLVKLRTATLVVKANDGWPFHDDSLADLETAVRLLRELSNKQWRQMVRPIDLWSPQGKPAKFTKPANPTDTLTLEDLEL